MRCQQGNVSGLRRIRALRNIRQCDLAVAVGVHQTTVSKLERGIPVSPITRQKIALELGVSEEELLPESKERHS